MQEQKAERLTTITAAPSAEKRATTHTFTVSYRDPETGVMLSGAWTVHRPTLGDLGRMAVVKAQLNGGLAVDGYTDFMHDMMANLQTITDDCPKWWKPADLYDIRPLHEIHTHVRSWVDSFRGDRVGGRHDGAAGGGQVEPGAGLAPAVVVPEVQQAAERPAPR